MNICLSILHYGPYEVTRECVDSFFNLQGSEDCRVVIVDNNSSNGSLDRLKEIYQGNDNISFVCNETNLGFAKGNNKGFQYAKNILKADVICVLNNDIVFSQNDFLDALKKCVSEGKADVIAPSIINSKGYFQNPLRCKELSIGRILYSLSYNIVMYMVYSLPIVNVKIAGWLEKRRSNRKNAEINQEMTGIVPHGAAIIYGPKYVENEEIAFLEKTFLFGEEDFLFEYIKRRRYASLYYPRLKVYHNEDSSIKSITKGVVEKRAYISKKKISSLFKLLVYRLRK